MTIDKSCQGKKDKVIQDNEKQDKTTRRLNKIIITEQAGQDNAMSANARQVYTVQAKIR